MLGNWTRALALAGAVPVMLGCTEPGSDPVAPADQSPVSVAKPGEPGAAADRILYQARLAEQSREFIGPGGLVYAGAFRNEGARVSRG